MKFILKTSSILTLVFAILIMGNYQFPPDAGPPVDDLQEIVHTGQENVEYMNTENPENLKVVWGCQLSDESISLDSTIQPVSSNETIDNHNLRPYKYLYVKDRMDKTLFLLYS